MYNLQTKIHLVKGVGPAKAAILNRLKIHTVLDLLEHKPDSYIFPGMTPIEKLAPGSNALIHGTVLKIYRKPTQATIVSALIGDGTGQVEAVWFNQIWLLSQIRTGMKVVVWGKVGFGRNTRYQFSGPKYSTYIGGTKDVAGGLYGKHTAIIRQALKEVLAHLDCPDWQDMTDETGEEALTRQQAFECLHQPEEKHWADAALGRLKFDELLLQQLALAMRRRQQIRQKAAVIAT